MTIHTISQVIGHRIPCHKLFKIMLQNNTKFREEYLFFIGENSDNKENILIEQVYSVLDNYINGNETEENETTDLIMGTIDEMMYDLTNNDLLINDKNIKCYRLTHDVCKECDFVVGIKFNEIRVRGHSYCDNDKNHNEYEWDFETLKNYGPSCTNSLKDLKLLSPDANDAKIFNIQDDCRCCS